MQVLITIAFSIILITSGIILIFHCNDKEQYKFMLSYFIVSLLILIYTLVVSIYIPYNYNLQKSEIHKIIDRDGGIYHIFRYDDECIIYEKVYGKSPPENLKYFTIKTKLSTWKGCIYFTTTNAGSFKTNSTIIEE